MSKKIVFAGTPEFAAKHLLALIEAKANVVAVYTQQDKKVGRGHKLTPSPVKSLALEHGIEVFTPLNFKEQDTIEQLRALKPDLMIVVAYGVILPQAVLDIPTLGCINVHGSLLPQYRGAAPIQRALFDGQSQTGITLMQMSLGLDSGDMLFKESLAISDDDTSESLFEKLALVGSNLLVTKLDDILNGNINPQVQDENLVSYAKKLDKSESLIDFRNDVLFIDRQIRALNPWPIATFKCKDKLFKVFKAKGERLEHNYQLGQLVEINKDYIKIACSNGILTVYTIQEAGKGQVNAGALFKSKKDVYVKGLICNE